MTSGFECVHTYLSLLLQSIGLNFEVGDRVVVSRVKNMSAIGIIILPDSLTCLVPCS